MMIDKLEAIRSGDLNEYRELSMDDVKTELGHTMSGEIEVKTSEMPWGNKFYHIHDPAARTDPAASIPEDDAKEIARQILESELTELIEQWRDKNQVLIHSPNGHAQSQICANELEAVIEDE